MITMMHALLGMKILSLAVSNDQHILQVGTDQTPVMFEAEGDCCSESWFSEILGVSALLGGTVRGVEKLQMAGYPINDGRSRQWGDLAYGYSICTEKGHGEIIFRNSSSGNGNYGGRLSFSFKEWPVPMTQITEDWQA